MLKKFLLGTALAVTLGTAGHAQDTLPPPPWFEATYANAGQTWAFAKDDPCRTAKVISAIRTLRKELESMNKWISDATNFYLSVNYEKDSELLQAANDKLKAQINQAKPEAEKVAKWLEELDEKKDCPDPSQPQTSQPPPPPQQPPTTPPAGANCVTPKGHLRAILVQTDPNEPGYMGVIWIDEAGNQFAATYNADGTSTWDGSGTAPAQPCGALLPQEPERPYKTERPRREVKGPPSPAVDADPPVATPQFPGTDDRTERKTDEKKTDSREASPKTEKSPSTDRQSDSGSHGAGKSDAKSTGNSEHATRTVTHEKAEVSHQVAHTNEVGHVSGIREGGLREAGMHTGGLGGMHAGGLGGMHLGGFGGLHLGGFGRL